MYFSFLIHYYDVSVLWVLQAEIPQLSDYRSAVGKYNSMCYIFVQYTCVPQRGSHAPHGDNSKMGS